MNRKQISTLLVLRNLGIQYEVESETSNTIIQKSVYLVQEANVNLGYYFNWYSYGPHCNNLSIDIEDANDISNSNSYLDKWELDHKTYKTLHRFKESLISTVNLSYKRWLELLSSTHFLISRKQVKTQNAKRLVTRFKKFNTDFTETEIKTALKSLQKFGIMDS